MVTVPEDPLQSRPGHRVASRIARVSAFLVAMGTAAAQAQQPVRPLPKVGGCPIGYYASGSYCVPSASGKTRGAIEKTGNSCPLGWFSSGSYCVKSR